MPVDPQSTKHSPWIDTLTALLRSAQQLVHELDSEPAICRVTQALMTLEPDERDVLSAAIENAIAFRRVNQSTYPLNGVRLRVNPNPRLFVRVVDGKEPPPTALEPEDVFIGVLRALRRIQFIAEDSARAAWEPAVTAALDALSPEERRACLTVARAGLARIEAAVQKDGGKDTSG